MAMNRAPMIPPIEAATYDAPPVNGTVPLPAGATPEPDGATAADVVLAAAVGEADIVVTTLDCVTVEDGDASALLVAEGDAVVEAEAAVATQSQTALAAPWTLRAVAGPQAEMTQPRAAEAMAADWEELHWQA
ncbi:MAG: hypothetical protein Q9166_004272 [cf. Caloplaca sp. 2 TL-2023]